MTFNVIAFIAFVTIPAFAAWFFGYNSKPNKEARKLLEEKEENELRAKARQEEHGREKNRKAVQKMEIFEVVSEAIRAPEFLRGIRSADTIREFVQRTQRLENSAETVSELRVRVIKQSDLIRDLQGQLKEISKALQLGQPIE